MQMCEKLRKMEAERVSLVHQVCVEDYKLNEVLHRIEKVKTSKAAQDKLQKEHLRKLLAYEGDPLEDDTTLISLRKEIECLKKTSKFHHREIIRTKLECNGFAITSDLFYRGASRQQRAHGNEHFKWRSQCNCESSNSCYRSWPERAAKPHRRTKSSGSGCKREKS